MKKISLASIFLLSSCTTMTESLQLGAGMGMLAGGAATYGAQASVGKKASLEDVAVGAGIGMALGLLTSFITHREVESSRESQQVDQMEMNFGDLPPSPFVVPKKPLKKGGR